MNSIGCSKSIPFYNETTWGVDSPIKIESTQSIDNFIAIYCFLPFYWIEIFNCKSYQKQNFIYKVDYIGGFDAPSNVIHTFSNEQQFLPNNAHIRLEPLYA